MRSIATTIARFVCGSIEDYGPSKKVNLRVQYCPNSGNEQDRNFTKATPSGEAWMTIDNPAAACQFEAQGVYEVTFRQIGKIDPMTGQTVLFDETT